MKSDAIERFHTDPRAALCSDRKRHERKHKFNLSELVSLLASTGKIHSKEMDRELEAGRFQITRLLPMERELFQYRIRDRVTGRERHVAEPEIVGFSP